MNKMKKLISIVLTVLLCVSVLPVSAGAESNVYTVKIGNTASEGPQAQYYAYYYFSSPEYKTGTYTLDPYDDDLFVYLVSYNVESYVFVGWSIDGSEPLMSAVGKEAMGLGSEPYVSDRTDSVYVSESTSPIEPNTGITSCLSQFVIKHNSPYSINSSHTITPVFEPKTSPTYNLTVAAGAGGTAEKAHVNGDRWRLTAAPNLGYVFRGWQKDGESAIVSTDNPFVVTLTADSTYTAVFEQVSMELLESGFQYGRQNYASSQGLFNTYVQSLSVGLSEGERAGFVIPFALSGPARSGSRMSFTVYAGEGTGGGVLASYQKVLTTDYRPDQLWNIMLVADSMPAVSRITVSARLNDSPASVRTYDVSVSPSQPLDLKFLTTPQKASAGKIYDVASYVDEQTGSLSLYAAAIGGVLKLDGGGFAYMPGLDLRPGDNEGSSAYAYAIGGPDKDHLAAMVKETRQVETSVDISYAIYEYASQSGTWTRIGASVLDGEGQEPTTEVGLVMSSGDVWIADRHWNGTSWEASVAPFGSGVTFNSFKKINHESAYAGSSSGLWKYSSGSGWAQFGSFSGSVTVVAAASDGTATVKSGGNYYEVSPDGTAVQIPGVSGLGGSGDVYGVGPALDGSLYALVKGKNYANVGTSGYNGSYVYGYDDTQARWVMQSVANFNDDVDNASGSMDTKSRPNGVQAIYNPTSKLTLFTGPSGAVYLMQGTSTITFMKNDGTSAQAGQITGKILDEVSISQMPSVTRSGYSFRGWYLDQACTLQWNAAAALMPAKDIVLYAKWVESSGGGTEDLLAYHKELALAALQKQFSKYSQSDYSPANWTRLVAAYNAGRSAIMAAQPASGPYIENNVIAALNSALAAMQAIPADRSGIITVAVSMDANTLGLGYIIKPTLLTVEKNARASKVITDLLRANGLSWQNTGTIDNSFYLAQVGPVDQKNAKVKDYILRAIPGGESAIEYSDRSDTWLGEFDYYYMSGWMYSISDGTAYPSFPGVGSASWQMSDGEVMRWQFTVYGYGSDLNADNSAWGSASIVPNLGDKTALTWLVATLRSTYSDSVLEANKEYAAAMAVLTDPEATQAQVDSALSALRAVDFSKQGGGAAGSAPSVTLSPKATATGGAASVSVSPSDMASAVASAVEKGYGKIVIAPEVAGTAKKVTIELQKDSLSAAASAGVELAVETVVGKIELPKSALSRIAEASSGQVKISLEAVDESALTAAQKAAAGGRPVYDVSITSGGSAVRNLGGEITVLLPYSLKQGEDASKVSVWFVSSSGLLIRKDGAYDSATGLVSFKTDHLSRYAVGIDSWQNPFADVSSGDWFFKDVRNATENGLMKGTGTGAFDPNGKMTRAMIVTVLYRMEGGPAVSGESGFSDVKAGEWYSDAVAWASAKGIVAGYGGGLFGPGDLVTREQMASILQRYAKYRGLGVSASADIGSYSDSSRVSPWALEAVRWAVAEGLIRGVSQAELSPGGASTRSQVAAVLMRLAENVIG